MKIETSSYGLVIIGSGPGGYISAIRASQLGIKTALIEKNNFLGGTCLNVGCIPSKCLLDSTKNFFLSKKNYINHGILFKELSFDFERMMNRKNNIIKNINNGINYLMKKNNIDVYHGIAKFFTKNQLSIDNKKYITFNNCIISTGSIPSKIHNINFNKRIISSTKALNLDHVPKKILIVGGGVIGIEIGSIFSRLGSTVTIIDSMNTIISNSDYSVSAEMEKILKNVYSIEIYTSTCIKKIIHKENNVIIKAEINNNTPITFEADYCLVSIGRTPNTKHLELEKIGIKTNEKGFIIVDKDLKSSVNNIFAIGDVIGNPMLAHKAEEEGIYVVEYISGQKPNKINYNLIPSVIYSYPEVASVGLTEHEIRDKGMKYKIGLFPMKILGRSRSSGCMEGFIKMISDNTTDEILGVHIISEHASEMIMEAVVAMEFKSSSEDIYRICHPHPTLSESFKEVSLFNFDKKFIHM